MNCNVSVTRKRTIGSTGVPGEAARVGRATLSNSGKVLCCLCLLWLNGKGGFFGDALGLLEVPGFVDDDDAICVHEAVGDCGRDW